MKTKFFIGLCILLAVGIPFAAAPIQAAPLIPPTPEPSPTTPDTLFEEISAAFQEDGDGDFFTLAGTGSDFVVDEVFASLDGSTSVVWLAPTDPETGEKLATEPVVAIGRVDLEQKSFGAGPDWEFTLQDSENWTQSLELLPIELRDAGILGEEILNPETVSKSATDTSTYGGYYLPWAKGLTKRLSMGANHISCSTRCTYAFDFADGTMFPLLAAKGGTVYHYKDSCSDGDESCTNSLILEDRSTSPITYQIYLHLRNNSIPSNLKTTGAKVLQGQYIGDVDDTGYSTGHHVHFMVVSSLYYYAGGGYYWGTSVDITFKDVSTNWDSATGGGRPCLSTDIGYGKCQESRSTYTSGNQGTNPPGGSLVSPSNGTTLTTPAIYVSGYGTDDRGIARLSVLANYDGNWVEIGDSQTSASFATQIDLCEEGIPDGPLSLALRVWDVEGNQSTMPLGIRNVLKNVACSTDIPVTPTCSINSNQVALYSEPNLEGACQVFSVGDYANGAALGAVGDNNTASLQVGQNVSATLFGTPSFTGRAETFTSSSPVPTLTDRSLADNLTGLDQASSLKVRERTSPPSTPTINSPGNPTTNDSLVFSWNNTGGATKFYALLSGPVNLERRYDNSVSANQTWSVGSLPAGDYTLIVKGRIAEYGGATKESAPTAVTFTVAQGPVPSESVGVPYVNDMEAGAADWTASGLWHLASMPGSGDKPDSTAWVFNNGVTYAHNTVLSGDLTSPSIRIPIPPSDAYYLRFTSWYQTETLNTHVDQRRVQISVNGERFTDLEPLPLHDEVMQSWLSSQVYDLTPYSAQIVRIRFHFSAIDTTANTYSGWAVDDFSITGSLPLFCSEEESNDIANASTPSIAVGGTATDAICPSGDIDYYRITPTKGDSIQVDVTANGNPLDTYLSLLDSDGVSVLSENDDLKPGYDSNSRISFIAPGTGPYYLKVKSFGHPGVGDPAFTYTISVVKTTDSTKPIVGLVVPPSNSALQVNSPRLTSAAADNTGEGGIKKVEFWMHGPDWLGGLWQKVGTDSDGSDGWSVSLAPGSLTVGEVYSFYTRAFDWAGNQGVGASWNVSALTFIPTNWLYMPVIGRE